MKINPDTLYKPKTIAKYKLIKSQKNDCSYNFVLREIKSGRLKAINPGGKQLQYAVRGVDILSYNLKHKLV